MRKIDADALSERIDALYNIATEPNAKAAFAIAYNCIQEAPDAKPQHRCKECKHFARDIEAPGCRGDCINKNRQGKPGYYRNRRQGNEPARTKHFEGKQE